MSKKNKQAGAASGVENPGAAGAQNPPAGEQSGAQGSANGEQAGAGAAGAQPPAPPPPAPPKAEAVAVRLLLDCTHGKINQVVKLSGEEAERARIEGWGDPHKDAVAAAKSLAR